MKKKGMVRIVLGIIFIAIQVLGMIGNIGQYHTFIPPVTGTAAELTGFYIGYFLWGIVGIILLINGLNARKKSQDNSESNGNNANPFDI